MSHSFSRLEWQPLVVRSVFVASSFSPRSMRSGNECNWSFLVSVVCRAVCSLWRRFSEICAPSLPVGTRQTQETGSVRNYQALLRQMKIRLAKAKLQVLHVVSEMLKKKERLNAVVIVAFGFLWCNFILPCLENILILSIWLMGSSEKKSLADM